MIDFEDKQYPGTHLNIEEENFLSVKGKYLNFTNYADCSGGRDKSYSCQMRLDINQVYDLHLFLFKWVAAYENTPDKYEAESK